MGLIRAWPLRDSGLDYKGSPYPPGYASCNEPGHLLLRGGVGFGTKGGQPCAEFLADGALALNPSDGPQNLSSHWTLLVEVWHDRDTPANLGQYGSGREIYFSTAGSGQYNYFFRDEFDGHFGLWVGGHQGAQVGNVIGSPIGKDQWHKFAFGRGDDGVFAVHNGVLMIEALPPVHLSGYVTPTLGAEFRPNQNGITYSLIGGMRNAALFDTALTLAQINALEFPAIPMISGSAITSTGVAAEKIAIRRWDNKELLKIITPESTGQWSTHMRSGIEFEVTYYAPGCKPEAHGPYYSAEE